jgi:DNA-binding transcriptional ArsR family regulator
MSVPGDLDGLRFPCACVSARGGYSDPWTAVTKNKLLPDGTKEEILNLLARAPQTISQLAAELQLAPPSVYAHVNDMIKSELLREAVEWEKKHPAERYYEPNFPVFRAEECAEFEALCQEMATQVVALFERKRRQMERAFRETGFASRGWGLADVTQCLYANMQRSARAQLEQRGLLRAPAKHRNGIEWVFWAEEPLAKAGKKRDRLTPPGRPASKGSRRRT